MVKTVVLAIVLLALISYSQTGMGNHYLVPFGSFYTCSVYDKCANYTQACSQDTQCASNYLAYQQTCFAQAGVDFQEYQDKSMNFIKYFDIGPLIQRFDFTTYQNCMGPQTNKVENRQVVMELFGCQLDSCIQYYDISTYAGQIWTQFINCQDEYLACKGNEDCMNAVYSEFKCLNDNGCLIPGFNETKFYNGNWQLTQDCIDSCHTYESLKMSVEYKNLVYCQVWQYPTWPQKSYNGPPYTFYYDTN